MKLWFLVLLVFCPSLWACDLDSPKPSALRAGRVGQDLWAYWWCADEYTMKMRTRFIKNGTYQQPDIDIAFDWFGGASGASLFSRKPTTPSGASWPLPDDDQFNVLRAAMQAKVRTDEEFLSAVPLWFVANNGTTKTRPMYLPDGTASTKRADVGAICDCRVVHIKTSTQTRCPLMELPGIKKPEVTACTRYVRPPGPATEPIQVIQKE